MSQLLTTWEGLEGRRKLVVLLAAVAAVLAMVGIARLAIQPSMALLYGGLDSTTAGEVVAQLEADQIPYEVRGNAIYVPEAERDATRLTLAGQGLPSASGAGYEILDTLSGFGTTSQMFDAAYWRAKEGELARTILVSPEIRAARVHIAHDQGTPFARSVEPSASVTVTTQRGSLSAAQAQAVQFMVAGAVTGLAPTRVTVIDGSSGVVIAGGDTQNTVAAAHDATQARAESMRSNIERLLAARVGAGKAVVEVHLDTDMDSQTITERIVDPTSRVTVSSDTEERSENAQGQGPGGVTVASNLPDGDVEGGAGGNNRTANELRERLNFEVSETRRERVIQPGQVRKVSVAVIVDGIVTEAADGSRSWAPRPEEELTSLRNLVESAIGFDPARGDVVTIESLEFEAPAEAGTLAADGGVGLTGATMQLIQTAILGLVALILGLFVIRPILTQPAALPAPDGDGIEILDSSVPIEADFEAESSNELENADRNKIRNLRNVISERAEESAVVLRSWIDGHDKETA
ncbi:MAG: flagellar basal-body MS-ring/collar protein FliF [Pseudomonadota bacterium]